MGKVDIVRVLDLVEAGAQQPHVMVELDSSPKQPMTALEYATITNSSSRNKATSSAREPAAKASC